MNTAGKSELGLVRSNNEDALYFSDNPVFGLPNLYIVADGMGGHKSGEVASNKSIAFFLRFCEEHSIEEQEILDYLIEGVVYANRSVYELSCTDEELEGMGTTFSVCVFFRQKLYTAHVGDSRIYAIHGGAIHLITTDHTFVNEMVRLKQLTEEQAKIHPYKNMMTRAVGSEPNVMVDGYVYEPAAGTKILLCSDGLTNMVQEEEIARIAGDGTDNDVIVDKLVAAANKNGGIDNCSVIVFDIGTEVKGCC